MDDEDSNECVIIENSEETTTSGNEKPETRPIMLLFERLITNDCKQNTILTNKQIYSILQKEYDMDIQAFHPLEDTIYLNIVKRFLKDWPQWEEFDSIINRLKKINATTSIKNILEHKYKNLKEYLRLMIEATKPLAEKAIQDLSKEPRNQLPSFDTSDIVLEIYSTRKQLNELIFNKPHPEFNKTIINLPTNDSKITVQELPIESILNYPDVKLTIDLKFFSYNRCTKHEFKHKLVNSVLNAPEEIVLLKTDIQRKSSNNFFSIWNKNLIIQLLINIAETVVQTDRSKIECILNVVKSDFECMVSDIVKAPGQYRQYTNEHPYFRKLFKPIDVENASPDYDLHIRETISPMHTFYLGKVSQIGQEAIPPNFSWLKIECLLCKVSFTGHNFKDELVEHFKQRHVDEPDWTCSNCNETFTMINLCYKKWRHVCEGTVKE